MENFDKIRGKIWSSMEKVKTYGDLSDIGNEIGIIIGEYLDEKNTVEDFISGLRHGISLVDGTHP
jgi:hypothetical protein